MSPSSHTYPAAASDQEAMNSGLAIARNLARIYAEVLEAPLPEALQYLIQKWDGRDNGEATRAA